MRSIHALLVTSLLTGTASGQVVANPYSQATPHQSAALPESQSDTTDNMTLAQRQSKKELESKLDKLFKTERDLGQRGRIWAHTKEDWNDIHIVEGDLDKASKHYAAATRRWEAGSYEGWLQEVTQVQDVLSRARPQLQRIEWMIHARGGNRYSGGRERSLNSMVPARTESKKPKRP